MRYKRFSVKPNYTNHNHVTLVKGGQDYFNCLLDIISKARKSIHLQIYIYEEDETGQTIAEALIEAAARNVEVYMLIDGFASQDLSSHFKERLKRSGIHLRMFEPMLQTSNFYFGRRLHHKVVVVDGVYSLVGGVNISNKYNDTDGKPAWLDWALFSEGEVSLELLKVCTRLYCKTPARAKRLFFAHQNLTAVDEFCPVRVRRNDWVQRRTQITASYFQMFRKAAKDITIMSSYFIPGTLFRRKLRVASKKNIRIRLILAGASDVKLAKHAERFIYRWLLRHNIEIYEFQKTILHGKLATYDNEWATIGSFNINNISAFASVELNLDVDDKTFVNSLQKKLDQIIKEDCIRITEEAYNTKFSVFSRFVQWLAFNTVRLIFYIFTFYFRQG